MMKKQRARVEDDLRVWAGVEDNLRACRGVLPSAVTRINVCCSDNVKQTTKILSGQAKARLVCHTMELQTFCRTPFGVQNHLNEWKNLPTFGWDYRAAVHRCILKCRRTRRRYSSKGFRSSISCSTGLQDSFLPPSAQLADAKVIYSVAPAMGHNQESHPESNFRVPAIVTALEKMELTPKVLKVILLLLLLQQSFRQ
ncbi:Histone deacetylase [Bertholletia excelsa]